MTAPQPQPILREFPKSLAMAKPSFADLLVLIQEKLISRTKRPSGTTHTRHPTPHLQVCTALTQGATSLLRLLLRVILISDEHRPVP